MFAPSSLRQIYCSRACNDAHRNASRNKTPAKSNTKTSDAARMKLPPDHPDAIPGDYLRCRACGEFIHALDGLRSEHRECARKRLEALHDNDIQAQGLPQPRLRRVGERSQWMTALNNNIHVNTVNYITYSAG
jgi:hypothetical protein